MFVSGVESSTSYSLRMLADSMQSLQRSVARLSSGSKLAWIGEDPAGAGISIKFDAEVSRLQAARSNVGNATSFSQTQDGYLKQVAEALDRMSELSVLAQDTTKTASDRTAYNTEFGELEDFITATKAKEFNGVSLFDGTALNVTTDGDGSTFSADGVDLGDADYTALAALSITSTANAASAQTAVGNAINQVATDRANVGGNLARLQHTGSALLAYQDNLSAASSQIKDIDVAYESAHYARLSLKVQTASAILAQSNCLLYTSPSPRDRQKSRMPSSA